VRRRQFLGLMAGGVIVGLRAVGLAAPPPIGKPAPDFSLTLLDGRAVSLTEYRGKPVLVDFWHSG
jgi:cytochrome oxidase Cu insertion factor (SCO1/SenC/PrrC family)